jgi:microcystin-dependent protein
VSDPVGSLKIMAYTTPDSGYLVADGACVSQTTYATLFGVIGSTYSTQNSCTSGQFGLPDLRGRLPAGADNMGGTAANRLTVFSATGVGKTGGVQNSVVQQSNLASFTMSGTSNVSGNITVSGTLNGSVTTSGATGGGGGSMITGQSQIGTTPISTSGSLSGSNAMSGTSSVNSGGSSSAMTTFPNAQTAYYEIKF